MLDTDSLDITLLESETVGAILGQIVGTDADSGSNAKISYAIDPPGVLYVNNTIIIGCLCYKFSVYY